MRERVFAGQKQLGWVPPDTEAQAAALHALTATVLAVAWAAPASAQMCGAGQTTGSTASAPAGGGMMCGMGARPTAAAAR